MTVCDFAFTHSDSKMGYPEVDLGICPAVVAPWLVAKIGSGKARQLLLAGGTFSGAHGHAVGLLGNLVDLDDLHSSTLSFARRLMQGGPVAMATTKAWLNDLDGSMDDDILDAAAALSARLVGEEEAQGRLAAIFDR